MERSYLHKKSFIKTSKYLWKKIFLNDTVKTISLFTCFSQLIKIKGELKISKRKVNKVKITRTFDLNNEPLPSPYKINKLF